MKFQFYALHASLLVSHTLVGVGRGQESYTCGGGEGAMQMGNYITII